MALLFRPLVLARKPLWHSHGRVLMSSLSWMSIPMSPRVHARALSKKGNNLRGYSTSRGMSTCPTPGAGLPSAWAKTYAATTKEGLMDAYADWSATYDEDSITRFGYVAPMRAAQILNRHLVERTLANTAHASSSTYTPATSQARIVDIGAGTGLVGEELHRLGHTRVVGVDLSEAMLDIARDKGCYEDVICVDLQNRASMGTAALQSHVPFDAAVSVGTFTPNHVGKETLDAVICLVRPGGLLCLSLRDDFVEDLTNGFQEKLNELIEFGVLLKLEVTDRELYTQNVSDTITFRCWTFVVC
eukprot:m.36098 g.36098  ORF g.36098 m.36098 type:complete len:302 (-) comp17260_c0_seq1:98-1003(-)